MCCGGGVHNLWHLRLGIAEIFRGLADDNFGTIGSRGGVALRSPEHIFGRSFSRGPARLIGGSVSGGKQFGVAYQRFGFGMENGLAFLGSVLLFFLKPTKPARVQVRKIDFGSRFRLKTTY